MSEQLYPLSKRGFKRSDITGQQFGLLHVLRPEGMRVLPSGKRLTLWRCSCECGNETIVWPQSLKTGHTRSCGCIKAECSRVAATTHGMSYTHPIYRKWASMIGRCYNPNQNTYRNYGGKGVTVCDRWRYSFEAFRDDMLSTWEPGLTLERIDPMGDYNPNNCVWLPKDRQPYNKRNSCFFEFEDVRMTLAEWSWEFRWGHQKTRKFLLSCGLLPWYPDPSYSTRKKSCT